MSLAFRCTTILKKDFIKNKPKEKTMGPKETEISYETLAKRVLKLEETVPKLIAELKQKNEVIGQLKELINHLERGTRW